MLAQCRCAVAVSAHHMFFSHDTMLLYKLEQHQHHVTIPNVVIADRETLRLCRHGQDRDTCNAGFVTSRHCACKLLRRGATECR